MSRLLHSFFETAAARWPDAVALDIPPGVGRPDRQIFTYAELKARSEAISLDAKPGDIVPLLLPRTSPDLIASQLAILRAGAAYLCLEPSFPEEQIREILADSGTSEPSVSSEDGGESLAYLIYTSGTTGKPKGVMITHAGIANLVESDFHEFNLGPGDRVAQGSSAAYDSSVEETWLALASGATVVVLDDETARLGPDLVPWLREERITVLCPPPTLLRTTGCENPTAELPDLRLLYVGGEPLTTDVADLWGARARLVNGYGPTECTVTCLRCDIHPGEEITVGRPVPNMTAYILDEELSELPDGESGELCMGGVGLARGYHNSPELTRSKFVDHPTLGRIYRTGDAALRRPDGNIACFGRLDSQVKLRGYRIELEAIEVTLTGLPGVREAACNVQAEAGRQDLVAFIVPSDPTHPPSFADLREGLALHLPVYMVPARFGVLTELPRSVGGKLRRAGLPTLEAVDLPVIAPETEAETKIHAAFQRVFGTASPLSIEADFFTDLGGSSLLAAKLVSLMRGDPNLARVAVRDVYEAPTIAALAQRVGPPLEQAVAVEERTAPHIGTTVLQAAFILLELVIGSSLGYLAVDWIYSSPWLLAIAIVAYPPASVLVAITTKRTLIGHYATAREPVWGSLYLRNWVVQQAVRRIPWRLFEGTELTSVTLRLLGAQIGSRVHFHRGSVPLSGGWDLLSIGDDATLARDAALRLVTLEAGQLVIGPVQVGAHATVGIRAGISAGGSLGEGSELTALSSLSTKTGDHELWDGIPASRHPSLSFRREGGAGEGEALPPPSSTRPVADTKAYDLLVIVARATTSLFIALPVFATLYVLYTSQTTHLLGLTALLAMAATLATLTLEALIIRLLGQIQEGTIDLRSWDFIRVSLKINLLESAGRWLSGSLFWPHWLRLAGMKVGPDCEISTIMEVVPELVQFDGDCFLADGIYLGAPEIRQGQVHLRRLRMSRNTFIGNHAVIPAGQTLPEDILIGVCTVAERGLITKGTSWFGLPPFELPRREIVEHDRSLTHRPGPLRYSNRVFWEALRIVIPIGPACAMVAWFEAVSHGNWYVAPLITAEIGLALVASAILLKWLLLGKVRPGVHALWSCWCSRWDFHYVLWSEWARPILSALEGTLLLNSCLRLLGAKLGKRVVLGSGFAQIVDPDMIKIGDGATVSAMFQAHTFEDRVLKIDEVMIEPNATLASATVPLYGAEIGERTMVAAHGVVMKHERLLPGLRYEGAPTRSAGFQPASPHVTPASSREPALNR